MNTYFFSDEELSHLRYIQNNSPIRIWYEHIQYVFEYDNFHFILEVELAEKINISKYLDHCEDKSFLTQYAMKTKVKFKEEKFISKSGSELLFENQKISSIEIARTKLFFTKHRKISENYYSLDSSQINPTQDLPANIEIEKIIIADIGIVIKSESKRILNMFILDNEDDFTSIDYYHREGDFYQELSQKYQFISVN